MAGRLGFPLFFVRMGLALLRRPDLVPTAVRQVTTMAPRHWWKQAPFLPIPPTDYRHFRQVTATGSSEGPPGVHDTMVWLEWCRSMRQLPRRA